MKKRFTLVITLLLALVMSFALIACGGGDDDKKNETAPKKELVVPAAIMSLTDYMSAPSQAGTFEYRLDTEKLDELSNSMSFDRRGDKIGYKYTVGSAAYEYIFDCDTSLSYIKTDDGWTIDNEMIPQGMVGYVFDSVMNTIAQAGAGDADSTGSTGSTGADAAQSYEKLLSEIKYNAKAHTLALSVNYADKVNRALASAQKVYKSNGTLEDLIDAYLSEYDPEIKAMISQGVTLPQTGKFTVSGLAALVKLSAPKIKDVNIIDKAEEIAGRPLKSDYAAFLEKMGFTDEASKLAAEKRTCGEAIEGLLTFVGKKVKLSEIATGNVSSIKTFINTIVKGSKADQMMLVGELIQDVLINKVDMTNYTKDVTSFIDTIVDALGAFDFKDIIDGLSAGTGIKGDVGSVVKTIIATPVKLRKLEANVVISISDDYSSATGISVAFKFEHNYTGKTDLPLLSDNNYVAEASITLGAYSNTVTPLEPTPFVMYDPATDNVIHGMTSVIVRLDEKTDVSAYFESRMFDKFTVDAESIAAIYVDAATGDYKELAKGAITFDEKTNTFTLKRDAINGIAEYADLSRGILCQANVTSGEGDAARTFGFTIAYIFVEDATATSLGNMIGNMVGNLIGR